MSTNYYRLMEPIDRIEYKTDFEPIDRGILDLHIKEGLAGIVFHPRELMPTLLLMLADHEYPAPVLRAGRAGGGVDIIVHDPAMTDETQLISEYGELVTLAEVRAKATRPPAVGPTWNEYGTFHTPTPCSYCGYPDASVAHDCGLHMETTGGPKPALMSCGHPVASVECSSRDPDKDGTCHCRDCEKEACKCA